MFSLLRHAGSILWKRSPIQLTFFVTRNCNARCPYCFYLQSADHPKDDTEELSLDEIGKISRSLGRLLWLAFSGGEAFLRKDLVEISKIFYAQNQPVIMLYSTNGLAAELIRDCTEKILKHCPESVVAVKLSLDGLDSAHDELRQTPGGFSKMMHSYRLLGELLEHYPNFELGINTVFSSGNQDHMDEIIDFVQGLDRVKTHTISLVRGNLDHAHFKDVDYRKYRRAIERLEKNLKDKTSGIYRFKGARLKAAQDILQRRMIYRTALEQTRVTPCYAGRLNLVLTETGGVYPCETLTEGFGNVRDFDYDLRRVMRDKPAQAVMRSIQDRRCHCTHECYLMTNILFDPRRYPALIKEYLQL
ncbi:MAG: radical SAM protein [Burkholderiales bacterium]|nr:radical SAM protein [Burkholderiales bacterium]